MKDELIGESVGMHCVRAAMERFAYSHAPLVLTGETGTGKSRLARWMATVGRPPDAPFICMDGAALDNRLVPADVRYAWVAANGGTLFIDHVGEAPAIFQTTLADLVMGIAPRNPRASRARKVASAKPPSHTRCPPRLIVASQARLEQAVAYDRFDLALYRCMHGAAIHLPALRFRLEDIPELAAHFFAQPEASSRPYRLTRDATQRLQSHHWPGNVRELNNVLRRGLVLAGARTALEPSDIVFDARSFTAQSGPPSADGVILEVGSTKGDERPNANRLMRRKSLFWENLHASIHACASGDERSPAPGHPLMPWTPPTLSLRLGATV